MLDRFGKASLRLEQEAFAQVYIGGPETFTSLLEQMACVLQMEFDLISPADPGVCLGQVAVNVRLRYPVAHTLRRGQPTLLSVQPLMPVPLSFKESAHPLS